MKLGIDIQVIDDVTVRYEPPILRVDQEGISALLLLAEDAQALIPVLEEFVTAEAEGTGKHRLPI